jgi:hypothetical protein
MSITRFAPTRQSYRVSDRDRGITRNLTHLERLERLDEVEAARGTQASLGHAAAPLRTSPRFINNHRWSCAKSGFQTVNSRVSFFGTAAFCNFT